MRDPIGEIGEALRRAADGARAGTPNGRLVLTDAQLAAVRRSSVFLAVEPCPLCGHHHAAALACALAGR